RKILARFKDRRHIRRHLEHAASDDRKTRHERKVSSIRPAFLCKCRVYVRSNVNPHFAHLYTFFRSRNSHPRKPQTIAITQQPTPNKTTKVKAKTCPAASGLFSDSGAMNELTPAERMINTPIAKPKNERAANT